MNVMKLLKWLVLLLVGIMLVVYLGNLLLILMSAYILYTMLHPVKKYLQDKLKLKSHTLSSLLAILFPALVLSLVVLYIFPVIITQINSLSYLSYEEVFDNILHQFYWMENIVEHLGGKKYVLKSIEDTMIHIINIQKIAEWSSILLNNFSHIFLNLLITFFITFHLLKDENLLNHFFDIIVNDNFEKDVNEILMHIKIILGKYFRGLLIDVLIIMTINSLVLSILGVRNAFLIGILSGVLNIIPYVGPLITLLIGLFLGVSSNILEGHYELIGSTALKIFFTLFLVNLLDGTIIQPYIFSNVLKAHPLEIFLVIVSAGMLGGILWMMLIIPIYVILKVVVTEVYTYFKKSNNA